MSPEPDAVLVEVGQAGALDGVHQVESVVGPAERCEVFGGVLVVVRGCVIAEVGVYGYEPVGSHEGRLSAGVHAAYVLLYGKVPVVHDHDREGAAPGGNEHLPGDGEVAAAVGNRVLGVRIGAGQGAHHA